MKPFLCAALGAALVFVSGEASAQPGASTLIVRVRGVSPKGGDVRLALYTKKTWPDDDAPPVIDGVVTATAPETIVTLRNIPPGVYGLKSFQDFNRNGQFDFTWLHLPAEKYGFSNDAVAMFSAPAFDRAKFTLSPGENTITIHLR